jgi:uncharacterized membrane protein YvbJ
MKYCDNCGTSVSANANYCQNCGKKLSGSSASIATITSVSLSTNQTNTDRQVYCDIASSDVTIVEDSKDEEIRLICPHAKRFDGYGWYRIDCKVTETMFSIKKCGIFEGMRKFSK